MRREVARHERVALGGDLASDAHRRAVDVVDAIGEAHGRELVVAGVEGHGLQHLGARHQELAVQLRQGLRMLDHHLRRERTRLHVAALLQLEQVAAVAQHRTFGQPFQDPLRHVTAPLDSAASVRVEPARSASGEAPLVTTSIPQIGSST